MKKNLKVMLSIMLIAIFAFSAVTAGAATVDTSNSGYVVISEDFSAVTDHTKVSTAVNGGTEVTSIGNQFYKNSRVNKIGDSDWVFKTPSEYNLGNADAYISENGELMINSGSSILSGTYTARIASVYYDGDYSKVGNDFKISFDFNKASVSNEFSVKFMLSEDVNSYYALNMETGTGRNVWNLYKVTKGTYSLLTSSAETISAYSNVCDAIKSGTVTVVYSSGKISWNINATRHGAGAYTNMGSYTDSTPFTTAPSNCAIGFSSNGSFGQFAKVDNVVFSYAVSNISENFENENISTDEVANTTASSRTQITGTDYYVTTKANSLNAKLTANKENVKDDSAVTSNRLKLSYKNASIWNQDQINKHDFAEYRGDYTGIRDNYTISFDYCTTTARNSAVFLFGLPANDADNYEYNDYYALVFSGETDLSTYVTGGEATAEKPVPSWEIRKMDTDTWSDTIVKSDNGFALETSTNTNSDARFTINKYGTKVANVVINVNNGAVTVTVNGTIANKTKYSDTKTFTLQAPMAGNHFAFSNCSKDGSAGYFDNIVVNTYNAGIESDGNKVYINSGKFPLESGTVLFSLADGTFTARNIDIETFKICEETIPEGTNRIFFWKDLDTLVPLAESINLE